MQRGRIVKSGTLEGAVCRTKCMPQVASKELVLDGQPSDVTVALRAYST
jgi:hypothetical protein